MSNLLNPARRKVSRSVAGMMRNFVQVESVTRTPDGQGGNTEKWGTFAEVWAYIEPASASQINFSEQLQHRVTHKIYIRYLPSLTSEMRIRFGSRIFQVQNYRDLEERHEFYEVMAEEGKPT